MVNIFRPISGGSMNPARTIGPAIASSYYKGIWVYVIGPITGTLLGAFSYNLIRVTTDHHDQNDLDRPNISPNISLSFGRFGRIKRTNETKASIREVDSEFV